jgi:hypothetical protein
MAILLEAGLILLSVIPFSEEKSGSISGLIAMI